MSGTSVTPPWLKEEGYSAPAPTSGGYSPVPLASSYLPPQPAGSSPPIPPQHQQQILPPPLPAKLSTIHFTLKVVTILLCILMDATAVIGIGYIDKVDEVGEFFVAAYMLFFGTLLLVFEVMGFRRVEWVDHWFRRNCGFLYSAFGKSLFIIFIAFLCFGLGDPQTLTLSTGLALAAFGSLQVGLYLKYPEIFEDKDPINR